MKIKNIKDIVLYYIIKTLFKRLSISYIRSNIRSVSIFNTSDGIAGNGCKYYIIDTEPEAITHCKYITRKIGK